MNDEQRSGTEARLRDDVRAALAERVGNDMPPEGRVPISWPVFDEKEVLHALDTLLAVRISQGAKVQEFERRTAEYFGKKYAVAVNSGSSANLIALSSLVTSGKVPKGSEVILPATTFSTVASPILQVGLIPVYVDVDPVSWNIDPDEVEQAMSDKTRVLMPVHTFGNPADMRRIMTSAEARGLIVLEDCCEAHGAAIGEKKVGSFGDLATLSFFVAHNITTGEGGMVFTDEEDVYELLQSLREFGRLPLQVVRNERFGYKDPIIGGYDARYIFSRLGYNVRMTDIAAALGIEQIQKLDALNQKRIAIVNRYQAAFMRYEAFLTLPTVAEGTLHSFYGYPFVVRTDAPFSRHEFVTHLEAHGIETRPFFGGCLPDQPAFRDEPKRVVGELPTARMLRDQSIFIGYHPALTEQHIAHVLDTFAAFFNRYR